MVEGEPVEWLAHSTIEAGDRRVGFKPILTISGPKDRGRRSGSSAEGEESLFGSGDVDNRSIDEKSCWDESAARGFAPVRNLNTIAEIRFSILSLVLASCGVVIGL